MKPTSCIMHELDALLLCLVTCMLVLMLAVQVCILVVTVYKPLYSYARITCENVFDSLDDLSPTLRRSFCSIGLIG